jgi:hypothetical protein
MRGLAMSDPVVVAVVSVVGTLAVVVLGLLALSGGNLRRLGLGLQTMRDPALADKVHLLLNPPPPEPPKPSAEPVRLLTVLQREGRLLDFLTENLAGCDAEQIAAAVRDLHPKWQAALLKHLELEPVLPQEESSQVEVPQGFDPSAIRLTGNVTGQPPFRGTLLHRGWRVKQIKLTPLPEGQDEFVLQPAEVELP